MLTFIQISDTHVGVAPRLFNADTHERFRRIVEDINASFPDAAFVVNTGDIGGIHGEREAYRNYRGIADDLRPPVRYALGNHDDRTAFREVLMDAEPMDAPWHWAFEEGGWLFAGIDSSRDARVPDSELHWLGKTFDGSDAPAFLFLHHHPLPIGNGLDVPFMLRNSLQFLNAVAWLPQIRFVAFGHMHLTRTLFFEGRYFFCMPSPACRFSLVPTRSPVEDTTACYLVFRISDDGTLETWIRLLDDGTALADGGKARGDIRDGAREEAREIISPGPEEEFPDRK